MIAELLRRLLYGAIVQAGRRLTGVQVHYKAQYSHDYLHSARWFLMRKVCLWRDGGRCTYQSEDGERCAMTTTLQVHHWSYRHKGAPGLAGFLAELRDCEIRCDAHHSKES